MKVLITGGAGFIGSHLAEGYLDRGDEVYIIDDLSTGSLRNIQSMEKRAGFYKVIDTILNEEVMLELTGICDVIIHLAAAVGVKYIIDNPLPSIETNVRGTEIVLKSANKFRKKVFIASTSEVYGKNTNMPLKETDDRIQGPTVIYRWCYSCTKALDEFHALAYHKTEHLPVVIARFFNTVGPRQTGTYGMVIPRFVMQSLQDKPLTVFGDGKQTRTFTYIGDVIKAIMKLMDHPDAVGEIVNIGGVDEISIEDLAKRVIELTGSSSEIRYVPYDEAYEEGFEDMPRRVPDLTKLEKVIGYKPQTSLDEIIKKVIEFHKAFGDTREERPVISKFDPSPLKRIIQS
jgi:UDP-glucose 4-epimerase